MLEQFLVEYERFLRAFLGAHRPVLVRNMIFGGLKGYSAGSRIRP